MRHIKRHEVYTLCKNKSYKELLYCNEDVVVTEDTSESLTDEELDEYGRIMELYEEEDEYEDMLGL